MHQPVIFKEYDIRGIVNKEFDMDFAYDLGKTFVKYMVDEKKVQKPIISVGYDARLSSPALAQKLHQGILDSGGHVVDLGLVTSPMTYFSTFELSYVSGAIQITGSHNPPEYNGFKISAGKYTIYGNEIQKLRKIMDNGEYYSGCGEIQKIDIIPQYIERYKKEFGQLDPVNVVLDCGNGAAGVIVRKLFESAGIFPTILLEEPDGHFPHHHPDPTVEKNLTLLKRTVKEKGAICGIGFDGDADRIGVVDHQGNTIYGDELMVVISRYLLEQTPGIKIVGEGKCSDRMYDDIQNRGGIPIMWKTGHSLIKDKIKEEKAAFGGEMSGHIFFADRNYGYDDAPYAALRLVEILSKTGKTIPELLEGLPKAYNTPEIRIDTTEEKKKNIVEKVTEYFKNQPQVKLNLVDGVRASYNDGWALCRCSNTQPVVVLRYESQTEEGLQRIKTAVESVVNQYL